MSTTPVSPTSHVIHGIQALHYPHGWYVPVAERLRILHQLGTPMSVLSGDVLTWHACPFYRARIEVDGCRYIGDADLHLDAAPGTPDATNPISCGQTAAIGQALECAGFGDLKSLLARVHPSLHLALSEEEATGPLQQADRVQTVLLGDTAYVTVAERLFHVHHMGKKLSMLSCDILELAGVWVYRVVMRLEQQQFVGDAEIFFEADPASPNHRHPISCAQISALGNALALAGFADEHSILQRLGADIPERVGPSVLTSADVVLLAQQHQRHQRSISSSRCSAEQRQRLATLCQRLGKDEPDDAHLDASAAQRLLEQWQAEEADLLQEADRGREASSENQNPAPEPSSASPSRVAPALVRHLASRWRGVFQPQGDQRALAAAWDAFKIAICGERVSDHQMAPQQYERLLAACAPPQPSRPPQRAPQIQRNAGTPLPHAPRHTSSTPSHY